MESATVMIHVRFAPNGTVVEISERPASVSPQDWFNWLSDNAPDVYQALAGGRGVFRIQRDKLDAFKLASVGAAAA
jgi:hypothetical protein